MDHLYKQKVIEALIFASDESLSLKEIVSILKMSEEPNLKIRMNEDDILSIIRELNAEYVASNRSFRIIQSAGGFLFATLPDFATWLGLMVKEKAKRKLSQSALETLAVIAYKQPVTKPEIEAIRGVNVDYMISTLLERDLITIVGRSASPGRPLLYGTTLTFLKHFGINDLIDLPKPREIDEILNDSTFEVEKELMKRLGKDLSEQEDQTTSSDKLSTSENIPQVETKNEN